MRLRFWTDSLNRLYDRNAKTAIPEHPVIYELNQVFPLTHYFKIFFFFGAHLFDSFADSEQSQSKETPLTKAHPSKTKNVEHDV